MTNIEKVFREIKINDPKIRVSGNYINLKPNYWNISIITTYIPILLTIFIYSILQPKIDIKALLLFFLAFIMLPIVLVNQLKYYNNVIFDFASHTISIKPNYLLRIFVTKKTISFNDVKSLNVISNENLDGSRAINRRYIIALVLKSSANINLISFRNFQIASEIATRLWSVIK